MKPIKRTPAERAAYQELLHQTTALMQRHADADYACGRKWVCACGACRTYREDGFKPAQERRTLASPF